MATYFRPEQQFTNIQIVIFDPESGQWQSEAVSDRSSDFELGGTGSKSLPISRPLILFEERQGEPQSGQYGNTYTTLNLTY